MNEFEQLMEAELAAADRRAARENELISRAARGEPFWGVDKAMVETIGLGEFVPGNSRAPSQRIFDSLAKLMRSADKTATELVAARVRIAELWGALADLIARVERTGGYASPEEQDVLHRARQVLR